MIAPRFGQEKELLQSGAVTDAEEAAAADSNQALVGLPTARGVHFGVEERLHPGQPVG